MDPQNILNSKGFIIEMIKTGTNANFLLKNTLKTDAVFTIYMAAETEFLYIESETVRKHENITIGSFNMELLPCIFLIEIECFYESKE